MPYTRAQLLDALEDVAHFLGSENVGAEPEQAAWNAHVSYLGTVATNLRALVDEPPTEVPKGDTWRSSGVIPCPPAG